MTYIDDNGYEHDSYDAKIDADNAYLSDALKDGLREFIARRNRSIDLVNPAFELEVDLEETIGWVFGDYVEETEADCVQPASVDGWFASLHDVGDFRWSYIEVIDPVGVRYYTGYGTPLPEARYQEDIAAALTA